jgi:ABC-type glutathione transport system ATPase component
MSDLLLECRISVDYPGKPGVLQDVRLEIRRGEILGLAGPSGSGKSTISLAILRLLEYCGGRVRGEIRFDGLDLMRLKERELRRLRGSRIGFVMQSPAAALNPALRLETHLREAWRAHSSRSWREARPEVRALLTQMGLPNEEGFLRRYPGQVSVGQAQRVVIAMAVLHKPQLIIADEPTSALDAASRVEILQLFRRLNREYGTALLFISHDLESMNWLCPRVCSLHNGGLLALARELDEAAASPEFPECIRHSSLSSSYPSPY